MPRRAAIITQADLARAIRAMKQEGYAEVRVVFRDGAVIVEPVGSGDGARQDDARRQEPRRTIVL